MSIGRSTGAGVAGLGEPEYGHREARRGAKAVVFITARGHGSIVDGSVHTQGYFPLYNCFPLSNNEFRLRDKTGIENDAEITS